MNTLKTSYNNSLNSFCIVGINYRKSDMDIRDRFSLSSDQALTILKESRERKIPGCLALSTCNRTEIYGLSHDPDALIDLLCENSDSTKQDFSTHGYTFTG